MAVVEAATAAAAGDLVERWRELAPSLWAGAGAAAAGWFLLYGVLWVLTEPRGVKPAPGAPDVAGFDGPETPAVVNLVTNDWDLGRTAVPATLLDLAARGRLDVDQVGDRTLVRVRRQRARGNAGNAGNNDDELREYERMALGHVAGLAAQAVDGVVPAEALTTGPQDAAERWWKRFRHEVVHHARELGLSRPRWSRASRTALIVGAVVVGIAVALAASATLRDDPNDPDDGDPRLGAAAMGVVAGGAFVALTTVATRGERDTPAGRESAARWLALRQAMAQDSLLAEHPPAGVALWGRHLAHGAALGVAHGAVAALPLGAESETEAWSSVGGRWRVVRIRYPNRLTSPGYGLHPLLAGLWGLGELALGVQFVGLLFVLNGVTTAELRSEPALLPGVALAGLLHLVPTSRGLRMLYAAGADLVGGRRTVEGRVLRRRERRDEDRVVAVWLAVDDGSTDRLRAWRVRGAVAHRPGDTVRARVTRRLRHVRDLEPVPTPVKDREPPGNQPENRPHDRPRGVPR